MVIIVMTSMVVGLLCLGIRVWQLQRQITKIMVEISRFSPTIERRIIEQGKSRVIVPPKWQDDLGEMYGE